MFSAAEMQLIRNHHEADYKALLNDLSLPPPVWKDGDDELRFYDDIDDKLTKELCALMKSSTLYDGYTELLKLGGVGYDYSETFNQMLGMVVANREKILRGLEHFPKFIEEEVIIETQEIQQVSPSEQKNDTKHVFLPVPIGLGAVLILFAIFGLDHVIDDETVRKIVGGLLAVSGIIFAGVGVKGKTVPVEEKISITQTVTQPVRKKQIVRKEVKPPFTRNELQRVLDVLMKVEKIVRAI